VALELAALALILGVSPLIPSGTIFVLYVLVAEFLATYLIHCPAHYVVGRLGGIRFRGIRLGRTALVNIMPARLKWLGRLIPTPTLATDRTSLVSASKSRASAMYLSGTIASSASAVVIASVVSFSGPTLQTGLAWALAIGYVLFDAIFSPKGGDIMRARAVGGP
jgi:hypothetical protein